MTLVRSATPTVVSSDADGGGPGERLRRLRARRRLVREVLVVRILVIALAATLVVLGLQELGSGQSVTSSTTPAPAYNIIGGPT